MLDVYSLVFLFVRTRLPPLSTRTDTLCPDQTLFLSVAASLISGNWRGRPQASRYQASVSRAGTAAEPSTISPNAAAQRRDPSAAVSTVSDTGSPVTVFRNNCVSPSPGSVPGTWKPDRKSTRLNSSH